MHIRFLCLSLLIFILQKVTGDIFRIGYITGAKKIVQSDPNDRYDHPGYLISGAISLAIDQINTHHQPDNLLINHKLDFEYKETYGKEHYSIQHAATFSLNSSISAIIGPQETCIHEARIAASFNKLMLTYFCDQTFKSTASRSHYSTFVSVKPPASQISRALASLLLHFNWRKVTIVYNNYTEDKLRTARSIMDYLRLQHIEVLQTVTWTGEYYVGLVEEFEFPNPFIEHIERTKNNTRIYVHIGNIDAQIGFMNAMQELGLLDKGEYFVVGVYTKPYSRIPASYLCGKYEDEVGNRTSQAFRSFLGIAPRGFNVSFYEFNKVVNEWHAKPPFNFAWDKKLPQKQVRFEAAYLHDSVFLYARAVNQCLAINNRTHCNPHDGSHLMRFIADKPYWSAMGYMGYINELGDAEGNYTLIGIKSNSEGYESCRDLNWRTAHERMYDYKYGLAEIGSFLRPTNATGSGPPILLLNDQEDISWPGGKVPLDEPECGFDGAKCPKNIKDNRLLTTVLAIVGLIICFCGGLLIYLRYRQWSYEKELDSLIWKINWQDLQVEELHEYLINNVCNDDNRHESQLCLVSPNFDLGQDIRLDTIPMSIELGYYKKQLVAIKKLKKRHVNITRDVKIELKMMRELRHDNLCQFIGACTEPVAIVMEYVKNNFKDMLYDENSVLDSMFITSLLSDLVKGMCYIHQSPLKSHGRLKPSNLLVDSRFVLKITDYGLHEFRRRTDSTADYATQRKSEEVFFDNMLWTAPELLRMPFPPPEGTQKGDVYSFALVLYEVYGRAGPFGPVHMDSRAIIEELRLRREDPLLRPSMEWIQSAPDCVRQLIVECWDENPNARPDFQEIKNRLKPMTKGMKPTIMDNVLALLQRYANNLEQLVSERTIQLQEEKKKTETLLYEILPRPVAENLIREQQVEAEQFECVTIFFSDIVGFTALSAESTPFEVVTFLNDLYTLFDTLLAQYDAYKVETIGDSYMVSSGLPVRNGNAHAGVIASMALHLLETIKFFRIAHRPEKQLLLRIGIHSGPVVAGVVGRKMPRYCLFGDTVNTASRFESTGEALKIHCSAQCKAILDELGGYVVEPRGIVKMKGKRDQLTYWVVDENEQRKTNRNLHAFQALAVSMHQTVPVLTKWGSIMGGPRGTRRTSLIRNTRTPLASPQRSASSSKLRLDNMALHNSNPEIPWTASVTGVDERAERLSLSKDHRPLNDMELLHLKGFVVTESQSGSMPSPTEEDKLIEVQVQ